MIGIEERKILINIFSYPNFNYCPLVWHFSSKNSINKTENIQKRALRFLLNDYSSDYETLLKKTNKSTIKVKRMRLLASEISKPLMKTVRVLLRTIFKLYENSVSKKYDSKIPIQNSVTFGDNSLRSLAPRVSLPKQLKTETSYVKFKEQIDK